MLLLSLLCWLECVGQKGSEMHSSACSCRAPIGWWVVWMMANPNTWAWRQVTTSACLMNREPTRSWPLFFPCIFAMDVGLRWGMASCCYSFTIHRAHIRSHKRQRQRVFKLFTREKSIIIDRFWHGFSVSPLVVTATINSPFVTFAVHFAEVIRYNGI